MRSYGTAAATALWLAVAGSGFAQTLDNPQTPTQTTNGTKKRAKAATKGRQGSSKSR